MGRVNYCAFSIDVVNVHCNNNSNNKQKPKMKFWCFFDFDPAYLLFNIIVCDIKLLPISICF